MFVRKASHIQISRRAWVNLPQNSNAKRSVGTEVSSTGAKNFDRKHKDKKSGSSGWLNVKLKRHPDSTTRYHEETMTNWRERIDCPITPGEIIKRDEHTSFQALVKLGWGESSIVWLAKKRVKLPTRYNIRNFQTPSEERWVHEDSWVALKIKILGPQGEDREQNFTPQIDLAPVIPIRRQLDSWIREVDGNKHIFLELELMRETLERYRKRFPGERLPLYIIKPLIYEILTALKYMHAIREKGEIENLVHTDITEDNLLMELEPANDLIKPKQYEEQRWKQSVRDPHALHIYITRCRFGKLRTSVKLTEDFSVKLADFGSVTALVKDAPKKNFPIQKDEYRAPEVILGAGWSTKADIWNVGALLWKLGTGKDIFELADDPNHKPTKNIHVIVPKVAYDGKVHIAQMIALLGPPPKDWIQNLPKEQRTWLRPTANAQGKMCETPDELYGGPFFERQGEFLYPDLVEQSKSQLKLEQFARRVIPQDADSFITFAKKLMTWNPDERPSAEELLKDPWLPSESRQVSKSIKEKVQQDKIENIRAKKALKRQAGAAKNVPEGKELTNMERGFLQQTITIVEVDDSFGRG